MEQIQQWLTVFQDCVQTRDYDRGEQLFFSEAKGFGTRTVYAENRADLIADQWRHTWSRIKDFTFDLENSVIRFSEDHTLVTVIVQWQSWGVDTPQDWGKQEPYFRKGRCTLVLAQDGDKAYKAVHSHFSLLPDGG